MPSLQSLRAFTRDIKVAHTLFALPFAASAFFLDTFSVPSLSTIVLLVLAMICARSYGMGANRYFDRHLDSLNPRTAVREIPAGRLTPAASLFWTCLFGMGFIGVAFGLSPLAGYCSIPVLFILGLYPFWKKLSWLTHWYLGICLGLAPIAVSIALKGYADENICLLGLAVAFWTGGFDILYSLQDRSFDLEHRLHSVPSRFGIVPALWLSRLSFLAMFIILVTIGIRAEFGPVYFCGVLVIGALLAAEHFLIREIAQAGSSKWLNVAFFNLNASVSFIFLIFTATDFFVRG